MKTTSQPTAKIAGAKEWANWIKIKLEEKKYCVNNQFSLLAQDTTGK